MIVGIDWFDQQIEIKRSDLARHERLANVHKGSGLEKTFKQLVYDDRMYLDMLKYARENYMRSYDEREENIGWCADK